MEPMATTRQQESGMMKQVVIEMRNGKPYVVSCPKKVEVIIREPKRKSMRKHYRTALYRFKALVGLV